MAMTPEQKKQWKLDCEHSARPHHYWEYLSKIHGDWRNATKSWHIDPDYSFEYRRKEDAPTWDTHDSLPAKWKCRVYSPEMSAGVQLALFKLGIKWGTGDEIQNTKAAYLTNGPINGSVLFYYDEIYGPTKLADCPDLDLNLLFRLAYEKEEEPAYMQNEKLSEVIKSVQTHINYSRFSDGALCLSIGDKGMETDLVFASGAMQDDDPIYKKQELLLQAIVKILNTGTQ